MQWVLAGRHLRLKGGDSTSINLSGMPDSAEKKTRKEKGRSALDFTFVV